MCSVYGLSLQYRRLKDLGISVAYGDGEINSRFMPYTKVPVVVATPQGLKLTPMNFSLVPSWSKEPKAKFATHNARIETITEKPAWREPFKNKHCLIPMTYFCESVYQGPHAGHVISFSREIETGQIDDAPLLFSAGLFDVWNNPETNEQIYSCSIITTEPTAFILENGHDRTPIFLDFDAGKIWLNLLNAPSAEMVDFLLTKNVYPDLRVTRDRPLKPGWEKRI